MKKIFLSDSARIEFRFSIRFLNNKITADYKKTNDSQMNDTNKQAKIIATKLNLNKRIETFLNRRLFITLKEHKGNFNYNPKCRLVNPAKSEIGKISKFYRDKINQSIRRKSKLNQWRSTNTVISWFKDLLEKPNCRLLKFDIVKFYLSITKKILENAINFARNYTYINDNVESIMMHSRKSLLFCLNNIWIKQQNPKFDVAIGAYDGAEICELVGLYIHSLLSDIITSEDVGLYRDNKLAGLRNTTGTGTEKTRKKTFKFLKRKGCKLPLKRGFPKQTSST